MQARWPDDRRLTRVFLAAVGFYFTAHWLLRSVLGGTFEMDEAEMVLLAQDFHLGYGPQPPLYNWWQALWFHLAGVNSFAIAGAKNVMIAATYVALFMGLRVIYPVRLAVVGALSPMLLPNFLWEGQRANTHSTAMCLMMVVFLWALARVVSRGQGRDYLFLGAAFGFGLLSKYTFVLYALCLLAAALSLPRFRAAVLNRGMALAGAVAVAIAGLPLWWMQQNPDKTLGSVRKFYQPGESALPVWVQGAQLYAASLVAGLVVVVVVALILRRRATAGPGLSDPAARDFTRLMARAFVLSAIIGAVAVLAAGVTSLQVRWLLPQFLLAAPMLMLWGAERAGPRALKFLAAGVAVLGVLALIAMADIRLRGAGSDSLRVDQLGDEIAARTTGAPLIVADYYYAGNLRFHRPDWAYWQLSPGALTGDREVVFIASGKVQALLAKPQLRRFAETHEIVQQGQLDIGHRFAPDQTRRIAFAILRP